MSKTQKVNTSITTLRNLKPYKQRRKPKQGNKKDKYVYTTTLRNLTSYKNRRNPNREYSSNNSKYSHVSKTQQ